jgi:hypothetical protein
MTKFLAALVASGVLLNGVALAATPTPRPTPKPHSVNYNASKSNTGNRTFRPNNNLPVSRGKLATPRPTPKIGAVNYNSSKSNTGSGHFQTPAPGTQGKSNSRMAAKPTPKH